MPLVGGLITFSTDPVYDANDQVIVAELGTGGSFDVDRLGGAAGGIRPGYYRVAVGAGPDQRISLPQRYADPSTSGLRCIVESGQPLILHIELE
jgi:hypothetical protein